MDNKPASSRQGFAVTFRDEAKGGQAKGLRGGLSRMRWVVCWLEGDMIRYDGVNDRVVVNGAGW